MIHSDREDDKLAYRLEDIQLSEEGYKNAEIVTEKFMETLHELCEKAQIDRINSSPLLSCIQTALCVNKFLKLEKIYLVNQLGEVMDPKLLRKPVSEFKLRTINEIVNDTKDSIDINCTLTKADQNEDISI